VRELSKLVDVILVVGAKNSSNSNRLREIGEEEGRPSYLIADGSEVNPEWFNDAKIVGITAGASAPEVLVEDVIDALRRLGPVEVSQLTGRQETIEFRLPAELTDGSVRGRRAAAGV
jgi:4-hydroxy-3-methylbut-2-enyl diphosphate reductase